MKLSIIICTFNEKDTICELVKRVQKAKLPGGWEREVFVVDNLSTDGTRDLLSKLEGKYGLKVIYQKVNKGKSHSVRAAIPLCSGDFVIPQDGDLEYDPNDFSRLIEKAIDERLDAVLGTRVKGAARYHAYRINEVGIAMLTKIINWLFGADYSDVATCYKLMRREKLLQLDLVSNGFNLDFELCAKFAKHHWRVAEVEISYQARTFSEGRKMRPLSAGLSALGIILNEKMSRK